MNAQEGPQDELESLDEIYQDSFDDRIEQSAIYRGVLFPCIKKKIVAIVLTPVCDIYQDKADFIRMAGFIPAERIFEKGVEKKYEYTPRTDNRSNPPKEPAESRESPYQLCERFARAKGNKYHFVPSYENKFPHSFVDFQLVESFSPSDVRRFDKVAVMKSPWKQSILARYVAYCGRVGTKAYSKNLRDVIMDKISRLTWSQ